MLTQSCGHQVDRRPKNPKTRTFLEGRPCGTCLVTELLERFGLKGDGRYLSKKQSRWVRDVVIRELGRDVPFLRSGDRLEVGRFTIVQMGAAFSHNANGEVIHVSHAAKVTTEEACNPALFGGEQARPIGGCDCRACHVARSTQ